MSVNKVILIGNLGQDPDITYTAKGLCIANISLATSEKTKDKQTGESKTTTEWHKIVMFGDLGEIANKWLKKGSTIYIEGRLRTEKYQDKEGNDRYTTKIIGDTMRMLGGKPEASKPEASKIEHATTPYQQDKTKRQITEPQAQADAGVIAFGDDDIPF